MQWKWACFKSHYILNNIVIDYVDRYELVTHFTEYPSNSPIIPWLFIVNFLYINSASIPHSLLRFNCKILDCKNLVNNFIQTQNWYLHSIITLYLKHKVCLVRHDNQVDKVKRTSTPLKPNVCIVYKG